MPDVGGWRRTRLHVIPNAAFVTLAPDWVAEVLSPSTERFDRGKKLAVYAREQVAWVWLVNPTLRTLEILQLGSEGCWILRRTHHGDVKLNAEPFDAIEFDSPAFSGSSWRQSGTRCASVLGQPPLIEKLAERLGAENAPDPTRKLKLARLRHTSPYLI